ncbi:iron transporter [Halobacteria archaeon AArc-curdl1]|uniref:Iron transporter n=1 Tax=Natronosalvus hydrolyticus TaxID=2979988 RepID=A0AAP2Z824_9EURY|nr:iron transporter [Halobacteria archaeon AArc-curdl1]
MNDDPDSAPYWASSSRNLGWGRRDILRSAAIGGTLGVAGCLERLGFEEQSAWDVPPLVADRPDAVYMPPSIEEMGTYGQASNGEFTVDLAFTFPHRFWLVAGDTERVDVTTDDTMHLMMTIWDAETGIVLPVDAALEIRDDGGDVVHSDPPWSMLSQRMGFHYGDNISLPGEGGYTARVIAGPVSARRTGHLADRLEGTATFEIDFEYARSDLHDLELTLIDEDERGQPGALEAMDHGDHPHHGDHDPDDGHHDHDGEGHASHPQLGGPPLEDLPGTHVGTDTSADASVSLRYIEAERFGEGDAMTDGSEGSEDESDDGETPYLAVYPRTPYNDFPLPFMAISITFESGGSTVLETTLQETVDHELGHHYGASSSEITDADTAIVTVDTPPQVARHDGYETAFFEFDPLTFELS